MGVSEQDAFLSASSYLPDAIREVVQALSPTSRDLVHEIRLRADAPLTLSCTDGEFYLTRSGGRTSIRQPNVLFCTSADVTDCVRRLCDFSLHSHQEQWRQGFVSARGCRAGIGGVVVTEAGRPVSFREMRSVCLRIARTHVGCAKPLLPYLLAGDRVQSAILCGAPSSGKTSLLRDLACELSGGVSGRRFRVAVIDERGELDAGGCLSECDVLTGISKAEGLRQAVRCLAPDVVLFDEWATREEALAVQDAAACGVAVITSCHSPTLAALCRRPVAREWLRSGTVTWAVELSGHTAPGKIAHIREVGQNIYEMDRHDLSDIGGRGARTLESGATRLSRAVAGRGGAPDSPRRRADPLFGGADAGVAACAFSKRRVSSSDLFAGGGDLPAVRLSRRLAAGDRAPAGGADRA